MVDKYESPEDILNFINSLMKSMEKLDKDHRFKYLLFLSFYHCYKRIKGEEYSEITPKDMEDIKRDSEEVIKLRNLYMTNITEKYNIEINENFVKDLRDKVNYLLQNRVELEKTIASSCERIILPLEKTWRYLKTR